MPSLFFAVVAPVQACESEGRMKLRPCGGGAPLQLMAKRQIQQRAAPGIQALALFELWARGGIAPLRHEGPTLLEELSGQHLVLSRRPRGVRTRRCGHPEGERGK